MNGRKGDPIEAWRELSAQAARASGVRSRAFRIDGLVGADRAPLRPATVRRPAAAVGAGLLTLAVVVVGAALVLRPSLAPAASDAVASPTAVVATATDDSFRLELSVRSSRVTDVEEIDPVAALTYLGPGDSRMVFHAASPILFRIEELGGGRGMGGGMDQPCLSTLFATGTAKAYPFAKSGSPTDDPATGFDRAWYEDPVLRLPAGQWRITAQLDATLGGCGGDAQRHQLTASADITVTHATATTDAVRATADDGTFRIELVTPRGIYSPTDAIEPVATVTFLGPEAETTMIHGTTPVLFSIDEIGGTRGMDGTMGPVCASSVVTRGTQMTFPFAKSGSIGEPGFDLAWFDDPVLRLPAGTWRIRASLIASTGDSADGCGAVSHDLDVDNVIVVTGDAVTPSVAPEPSVTPDAARTAVPGTPEPSIGPPSEDGSFRLGLAIPKDAYASDEAIEPVATLTFLGPTNSVEYGHSDPAIFFTIEQLDGDAQMTGGANDSCNVTGIRRDEPVQIPFHKSGQIGLGFDEAWFRDPVLRLPPGSWRISVRFEGDIPACDSGGTTHVLGAARVITVR